MTYFTDSPFERMMMQPPKHSPSPKESNPKPTQSLPDKSDTTCVVTLVPKGET